MKKYCTKTPMHSGGGTYYDHIFSSVFPVRMCVEASDTIYEIDVVEDTCPDNDSYWGWMDNDGNIGMVHAAESKFETCFPYGSSVAELAGNGRKIRVAITEMQNGRGE